MAMTTSTTKETLTFVVISLLVIALIFSSYSSSLYVFAKPVASKGSISCNPNPMAGQHTAKVSCCQKTTYTDGTSVTYCTDCDDTKPPSNCGPRYENPLGRAQGITPTIPIPPPSAGAAQPPPPPPPPSNALPPSTTCPDGSVPDANGNCPNTTTTTNQNPANNQAQLTSNNNNNNPTEGHHHKAKGNNDNSPIPPACPEGNEPIPPNCTLKPKF